MARRENFSTQRTRTDNDGRRPWRIARLGAAFAATVLGASVALGRGRGGPVQIDTPNDSGTLRTLSLDGSALNGRGAFFQSLGTNGRSCVTCHVAANGWSLGVDEVRDRFDRTDGLDPLFRTVDGSNSPLAKTNTLKQRRAAFSMLLDRGVIRVGLPIPANAEFELDGVDDPYGFASAKELSLFRRPLPTTNLRFLTGVMWDGRESNTSQGTTPISATATDDANNDALIEDLMHQANDATTGHAQGKPLTRLQQLDIVTFELNLATAQQTASGAGLLSANGAAGGAEALAGQEFYVTVNDVLGADARGNAFNARSMTLYDAWANARDPRRAAVARGAALFGSKKINITGVGGLNDNLNLPLIVGTCTTCHDTPNVGNHSVALPIDIGLTDEDRRTADVPLYTLRNRVTGEQRQTTDPGLALITGKWKDVGKFKGPVLRGLAARAPYFHNGSAEDLDAVLDFYEERFGVSFTERERSDLMAFLNAL